jgi:uroporphyrinogen-III synthase
MPVPLTGKTILVTRSAGQSSQFTSLLQEQGATVLEMPTLEITPPSTWEPLDQAIATLQEFDWLILTSANGVDYFFDRLIALGYSPQTAAQIKIAVVGKKTAASLQQRGLQPDYIPPNFVADSLVEHFPEGDRLAQLKLLFPRVETGGREVLVKELRAKGATVMEVPAYESGCASTVPPEVLEAFQQGAIDVITFASSKTVRCFCQMLGVGRQGAGVGGWNQGGSSSPNSSLLIPDAPLATPLIASIGPQTSITCQELLGRVDIEAEHYTLEGLTQAIVKWVTTG